MKTLMRYLLLTLCAQLYVVNVYALDPSLAPSQYHHQHWNNQNGLPQNTINSITQTTDGYLWLGTLEGVVQFDGINFTTYNTRNTSAIDHSLITATHTDQNGDLWLVNSKGSLIKHVNNQFKRLSAGNHLSTTLINTIYPINKDVIWIGTNGDGLIKYQNQQFTQPHHLVALGNYIKRMTKSDDGLWVASEKGLFLVTNDGQVITIEDKFGLNSNIKSLYSTKENLVLIGTNRGLIYIKNNQRQTLNYFDKILNSSIETIIEDSDENIWIATDGQGLIRIQDILSPSPKVDSLFDEQSIYAIFEDREKILWVGSHLNGLHKLKDPRIATYSRDEGLSHHLVRSVIESTSGSILIGTEGGGVNEYNNGELSPYFTLDNLSNLKVYSMIENADKSLWIGSDQGLIKANKNSHIQYTVNNGLSNNIVLAIHQANGGDLWIGTYSGGLNIFNGTSFKKVSSVPALNGISINIIYQDSRENIWIGTRGKGLVKYSEGKFTTYTTNEGLSDNMIFAIHEDTDGYLWIGTYGGGLNRLKDDSFDVISEDHGLYDNVIHKIVEDNNGSFWISSNRGIFNVSKNELNATIDGEKSTINPIIYSTKDGMRNAECNGGSNAGLLSSKDEVWFPTIDGVVKASRLNYEEKYYSTPTLINRISVNGNNINYSELPNIGSAVNELSISYTSPSLYEPEALRFKYKLEGIDDDWIDANNKRTAFYESIPAGEYAFSVKVKKTNTTDWQQQKSSIRIIVSPQYFETAWFKLLLAALTIAIIFLVYRIKVAQLKHHNRGLEQAIHQRTVELQNANTLLNQLAREDGLTGVINRRAFNEILEQEFCRAQKFSSELCLLLIDIDYFKQYNDALGHLAGDDCLINIAAVISQCCNQAGAVVARYGGDEFAVILPMIGKNSALAIANKICRSVSAQTISHPNSKAAAIVSVTVGVGGFNDSKTQTAMDLISAADKGLYNAKNSGKNQAALGN